ncbi:MAG: HAMP domain-containing histidine kinase [Planctomycetes bacterium]|nr:HAMP domain-containing histidine kinase [Planctomycetota bacterium]
MSSRRPLSLAISLAIVMITLLVILTVGWILLAVFAAVKAGSFTGWHWVLLTVGTAFIVMLLVGVVLYLILSIKAINLNRRQSNFIDSVTHELKSPIASMKLYLQTLNRRQVSEEERHEFYRFMLDDVQRLDDLISQILDAGRLESGRSSGDVQEVSLPQLLRKCAEAVCMSYRVPLEIVDFCIEPCTVWARPADLTLVFRNLLDNAVKYGGIEPEVRIEGRRRPNGTVVVRIADNGRGIPPRLRRKVFGRFVRLGVELERDKVGAGLGLYIVRTLVRQLRGRVHIRSREAGPGTVFEVELPCGVPPAVSGSA